MFYILHIILFCLNRICWTFRQPNLDLLSDKMLPATENSISHGTLVAIEFSFFNFNLGKLICDFPTIPVGTYCLSRQRHLSISEPPQSLCCLLPYGTGLIFVIMLGVDGNFDGNFVLYFLQLRYFENIIWTWDLKTCWCKMFGYYVNYRNDFVLPLINLAIAYQLHLEMDIYLNYLYSSVFWVRVL